ncbi:MAG: (d)CMP kinase, partial [Armatimonadetes bacterium]|nr:(d)CMP kinase [Armatimonadota bacterium]NIM24209.1 (d)CMP kinase [Armatimonadota bacterium]NIM68078.1 (d)CMP kinase [Armatimonadota bacterium]NIM76540.1 (d)CMP kinase [Armatimonadota bacterium]NIN06283.1 (d)CMP kinase [Armatimonadota bacterium]
MQLNNQNSNAPSRRFIIAIDGPAAAGKTTLARLLSQRLGYVHLDTGAMYRAVGWKANKIGIPLNDPERVTEIARTIKIRFTTEAAGNRIIVDSEDVTGKIRSSRAGEWASRVSAISGVRRALVAQQRKMGANGGVVVEGRDIQTVVFPQADVKIFLTASVEE